MIPLNPELVQNQATKGAPLVRLHIERWQLDSPYGEPASS
jgi:hypothetical protein